LRFKELVAPVIFIVLGGMVLGFLALLAMTGGIPEEAYPTAVMTAVFAAGFLIAGYGMLMGARWGWILGLAMVILDTIGNVYMANYVALAFDAVLAILLLLTARQYGIRIGKAPPTTPTTPIATIHPLTTKRKRYVRKIRRR